MCVYNKSNVIIVILYLITIGVSADKSLVNILRSQETYKNKFIYFSNESQKNGTLFYLLCDRSAEDHFPCVVFKEEHFDDQRPRLSPCNVTLHTKYPFQRVSSEIRLMPITRAKTLIFWAETKRDWVSIDRIKHILKFTIVDFETCRTTEAGVNIAIRESFIDSNFIVTSTNFAFYDNSFDVSYYQESTLINSILNARIDITTGTIVYEKKIWLFEGRGVVDIIPKDPRDPDKGHFYFNAEKGNIYEWDDYYLEYFPSYNYSKEWKKFRYSMRGQFITLCNDIDESKVRCDQIDFNGTTTMNAVFDLANKNIAPVPLTLRGGGFFLLTTECVSNCTEGAIYQISKVDVNGRRKKLIKVEGFNCDVNKFTHWHTLFENDLDSLCVSLLCYKSEKKLPAGSWIRLYLTKPEDIRTPEEVHVQCFDRFKVI